MRKVLAIIVCFITVAIVYANDGAFYAEGNHLIPNPDYEPDVKGLTDEEQRWVEFWK